MPGLLKSHAIDEGLVFGQPKEAGLGIARLGAGSDGSDFDKGKTEATEGVDGVALLIKTSGQVRQDGRKVSPMHLTGSTDWHLGSHGGEEARTFRRRGDLTREML